ncbi:MULTISPECIES: MerR family DNA-binding transcriptional regulator [unclassified Bacillus (in: firmicutes)]|nr:MULTISPECIES: MerR family DNA-binding transcriptional regulator [unclassified Bacillus (in: firmicutes)]
MYLVGQLSKITNISVRTLHYYEEIGILIPYIHYYIKLTSNSTAKLLFS